MAMVLPAGLLLLVVACATALAAPPPTSLLVEDGYLVSPSGTKRWVGNTTSSLQSAA